MMLFGGGFAVLFHIDCAAVFYVMWCGYPHNRAQLSTLSGAFVHVSNVEIGG